VRTSSPFDHTSPIPFYNFRSLIRVVEFATHHHLTQLIMPQWGAERDSSTPAVAKPAAV